MSTLLDEMSDEQMDVFRVIERGDNAIVDACAGSGKSTTILSIAIKQPEKQFIQLTYNSMLCSEIKTKAENLKIGNLKVYTYHSLAVRFYSPEAHTDTALRQVLRKEMPPRVPIPPFDVLVVDEAQDKTFLYFKFLIKFCRDRRTSEEKFLQILILGDYMQGLYDFKGADTRFLTRADEIWSQFELLRSPIFIRCQLKMSYRVTNPMADFVNHVMLGEKRLHACKEGEPVVYLRRKHHDAEKYVVHKILHLMKDHQAVPSDFFILSGSVKGENSAIRKMENILVEHHIPCHVPMFENEKIDERVIDGKVVFSTFHSVKGRQRKYVFVLEFNESYFTFYARNLPQDKCPNTLYVAATRATERLFIVESDTYIEDRPLPFLKLGHHEMKQQPFIDFHGMAQSIYYKNIGSQKTSEKTPTHYVTPTDLVKFISESVLEEISPILDEIFVSYEETPKDKEENLDIPSIIQMKKGYYEEISDLNGIAIPMMYYERVIEQLGTKPLGTPTMEGEIANGGHVLKKIIENNMSNVQNKKHAFLRKAIDRVPEACNSIAEYLYLANVYVASKEKLYFKLNQIDMSEYNWLSQDMMNLCFARLHRVLLPEFFWKNRLHAESEKTIIHSEDEGGHANIDAFLAPHFPLELFRFTARVDLITLFSVWELKCVSAITSEHLIQVVIYAWLWRKVVENQEKWENVLDFKIMNIKTGNILRLEATQEQLDTIVLKLLQGKYGEKEVKQDEDFVEECRKSFSSNPDHIISTESK